MLWLPKIRRDLPSRTGRTGPEAQRLEAEGGGRGPSRRENAQGEDPPPGQGVPGQGEELLQGESSRPPCDPTALPSRRGARRVSPAQPTRRKGRPFLSCCSCRRFFRALRRPPALFRLGSALTNRFLNLSREPTHSRASRSPSIEWRKPCSTSIGIGKQRRGRRESCGSSRSTPRRGSTG